LRRKLLCALMILCVTALCGCSNGENRGREAFEEFREEYVAGDFEQLSADITSVSGGSAFDCRVKFLKSGEEESVTVILPEEISGITARVDEKGTTVEYEGVILDAGGSEESGLTPVSAMFAISRAWQEGVFQEASSTQFDDAECWQITFMPYDTDAGSVVQTLVLSKENSRPLFAEIFCGGERMITVEYLYQ